MADDFQWVRTYWERIERKPRPFTDVRADALIGRARRGDVAAADRLLNEYRGWIYLSAWQYLFDTELRAEGWAYMDLLLLLPDEILPRLAPLIVLGEENLRSAVNRFEPGNRKHFKPYARQVIMNTFFRPTPNGPGGDLGGVREPRRPLPSNGGATVSLLLEDST